MIQKWYVYILLLSVVFACSKPNERESRTVYIKNERGKFTLYKEGKPYIIKGAAGYNHLDVLKEAGGNTVSIWDTAKIAPVLKQANELGLAVMICLPIPESRHIAYYNDTALVGTQFRSIKKLVNRYKNDPALLMWCLGNELVFPSKPSYDNFYKAYNQLVKMIHEDDPNHPVTTTMVNFQKKDIVNIKMRTDIDVLSFNLFGQIHLLKKNLKSFEHIWNGPYLISEWGVNGPWAGTKHTAWGAWIESSSTEKAKQYLLRYRQHMPLEDRRYLGSFIFYWGQKQETTHTWFSLFDEYGNKTEAINAASLLWQGRPVFAKAPQIQYMTLNGKKAQDNILVNSRQQVIAELFLPDKRSENFRIKWEIYPEDWYKKDHVNNLIKPKSLAGLIKERQDLKVNFIAPEQEGPYRIFVTLYDTSGNVSFCNTPFYVLNNK